MSDDLLNALATENGQNVIAQAINNFGSIGNAIRAEEARDISIQNAQLSRDWATKTDAMVENIDYSSKYYAERSKQYRNESLGYKDDAQTAKTDAENARDAAIIAKDNAISAQTAAETAKTDAITAKNTAVQAKTDAEKAKTDAETAWNNISTTIQNKADKATSLSGYGITDAYTKTESDGRFATKETTLAGYGITNAYTKTETDTQISNHNTNANAHSNILVPIQQNAGYHNSIYRGKNLGISVTQAQWTAIQNGTFDGMFIGDFWKITSSYTYDGTTVSITVDYQIASFDPYYRVGDADYNLHHLGIVPMANLYSDKYNDTNTTEGGYMGSGLFSRLDKAIAIVESAFGASHVPTHKVLLPTTCTGGKYTGWGWQSRKLDLLTEVQVYGAQAWGQSGNNGYSVASQNFQLQLFALNPNSIHNRQTYWLQDVASASWFAIVAVGGGSYLGGASSSYGVRPLFLIR